MWITEVGFVCRRCSDIVILWEVCKCGRNLRKVFGWSGDVGYRFMIECKLDIASWITGKKDLVGRGKMVAKKSWT